MLLNDDYMASTNHKTKRETETETERKMHTERHIETHRDTHKGIQRDTESHRETQKDTKRHRNAHRVRERGGRVREGSQRDIKTDIVVSSTKAIIIIIAAKVSSSFLQQPELTKKQIWLTLNNIQTQKITNDRKLIKAKNTFRAIYSGHGHSNMDPKKLKDKSLASSIDQTISFCLFFNQS